MLNQKSYFFQHTKSSDSRCHGCNDIIPQNEVRVYRNDHFEIYPYPTNGWFHLKCFWLLEEVKELHANDIMLEIDCRERNYETGFWQYQKHKIIKNGTQLSLHDGQNSCFYTSLAFYDSTNADIMLAIDEIELLKIREKLAEIIKDSMNTSCTSTTSSGYGSADDFTFNDETKEELSSASNFEEGSQLSDALVEEDEKEEKAKTKNIESKDGLDDDFEE